MTTGAPRQAAGPTAVPAVYLHIGTPKSGTTYLQSRIADNADQARVQGLLWPGPLWKAHVEAARELRRLEPGRSLDPDGPWLRLAAEARSWSGPRALISMEWLSSCTPVQVSAAVESLGDAEVHVVLTVRDLLRSFVAQWQQMTQQNRPWGWDQFVEEMVSGRGGPAADRFWDQHDLPAIVRRWGRSVPAERIHLVTVPPRGSDPDLLWDRFCSLLGLDGSAFSQPQRVNESLGVVSAALMHRVNLVAIRQGVTGKDYQLLMRRRLALEVLASRRPLEDALAVSAETDAWIRGRARQLVDDVVRLGVHVVGDLADLVPGDPLAGREPTEVTEAELLEVCVGALVELGVSEYQTMQDLRVKNEELHQRLARSRRRGKAKHRDRVGE